MNDVTSHTVVNLVINLWKITNKFKTNAYSPTRGSSKRQPRTRTISEPPAAVTELREEIERISSTHDMKNILPRNTSGPLFKGIPIRRNRSIHKLLSGATSLAIGSDIHRRSISIGIGSNYSLKAPASMGVGSTDSLYLRVKDPGDTLGIKRKDLSTQSLRPMYRRDVFYTGSITSLQRNNLSHGSLIDYRASNINLPVIDVHDDIADDMEEENRGKKRELN